MSVLRLSLALLLCASLALAAPAPAPAPFFFGQIGSAIDAKLGMKASLLHNKARLAHGVIGVAARLGRRYE
jgi:hypothetical protein